VLTERGGDVGNEVGLYGLKHCVDERDEVEPAYRLGQ